MFRKLGVIALLLCFVNPVYAAPGTDKNDSRATWFSCTMVSTATVLTELTGCAAVSGSSYYITSIYWSSSIISTTTNFFLLQSGTGTNCDTSTTSLFPDFTPIAFGQGGASFQVPIKATVSHALCFVHPGAGTRNVTVTGYRGP